MSHANLLKLSFIKPHNFIIPMFLAQVDISFQLFLPKYMSFLLALYPLTSTQSNCMNKHVKGYLIFVLIVFYHCRPKRALQH